MAGVRIRTSTQLVFDDGAPVRAASAIAPFGGGWLVVQDDETVAAWWRGGSIERVRLFAPVEGHDTFSEDAGTKELKPDLEAACAVEASGQQAVLCLGSGSLARRKRAVLVRTGSPLEILTADLDGLYERVAKALELQLDDVNLEGACVVGDRLRWFQRGHGGTDVPSCSVDLDLHVLLQVLQAGAHAGDVEIGNVRSYEFDHDGDTALAITDAAVLPDGRLLASVAAENAPDSVQDGEVVGSGLALLHDDGVGDVVQLPRADDGSVFKVEGLAVRSADNDLLDVLAVVDQDDPATPSVALELDVDLGEARGPNR